METRPNPNQNLVYIGDMERMAVAVAKSGLFGLKTPEQALALMLIAQAEGLHPAVAARDYHVIQGRPALKSDAMLARFQAAGGKVVWNAYTDQCVSGTFSHPQGGSATVEWTIAQAKSAGLTNKDVWKQYPRAMLRARVISEGIRTVYPGVSVGVYTPEELADFDAKPPTKDVEAVQVHSTPVDTPPPLPKVKPKSPPPPPVEAVEAPKAPVEEPTFKSGPHAGKRPSELSMEDLNAFLTAMDGMMLKKKLKVTDLPEAQRAMLEAASKALTDKMDQELVEKEEISHE